MEPDFWQARWQNNELRWHQQAYNDALMAHWHALEVPAEARVLVPFCGKSLDMRWLAARGHPVVGAELSEIAVTAFFEETGETPAVSDVDGFRRYAAGSVEILNGDFFALSRSQVGAIAGAYDRGGLVALPESMRGAYASQLMDLCAPGAAILLLSIEYQGGPNSFPPFSVPPHEIESLFGARCRIDLFEQHTNDLVPPALAAQGVAEATHTVYRLRVRQ